MAGMCGSLWHLDDGILTSINEAEAEYTKALKERVFVRDETRVLRYRVLEDAPLPNGRIVISDTAPFPQCVKSKDTEVAPLPHQRSGNESRRTNLVTLNPRNPLPPAHTTVTHTAPGNPTQMGSISPTRAP